MVNVQIVVLTPTESIIKFLDPDLCSLNETITEGGLRTIDLEYTFQDYVEDKELFRKGNKIFICNDINIRDCLYVINTDVKVNIFDENQFTLPLEEVLVELNNAPLVSHLDLSNHSDVFKTRTHNGALEVKIDWNSLNYWFGEFFNLGVVQDCLNSTVQWIPFFGTYNLMNLLRYIEEQTGNVFISRYEKDSLNNTIHKYLDFLNPINVNKNWELHLEYDFLEQPVSVFYDENGNLTTEDNPEEVTRFNTTTPTDQDETVQEGDFVDTDDNGTEDETYTWNREDETVIDEGTIKNYAPIRNINPEHVQFQIVTELGHVLNTDGLFYDEDNDETPLIWSSEELGFTSEIDNVLITLLMQNNTIGLMVNEKSFAVVSSIGGKIPTYFDYTESIAEDMLPENLKTNTAIPDDSYFEIYDHVAERVLFRTRINRSIGKVHSEVLDFAFNLDNIEFDVDEEDVYTGVSPILQYNSDSSNANNLTRANFTDLLTRFKNLSISKGDRIPMIMQKITVKARSLEAAKESLGSYTVGSGANESSSKSNYWIRPYKPQDNIDTSTPSNSTFEFLRATAYWSAPFTKRKGDLTVTGNVQGIEYNTIYGRTDTRNVKGTIAYDKIGTTESSDEDIYSIYNQCALYLKNHNTPKVTLDVDVSNLKNGEYNNYDVHDKVYIKLPYSNELITAKVIETKKNAHDISSNTIKLSNYTINTLKTISNETIINANNTSFKYPNSKILQVRLENLAYDKTDQYSIQYPANKLLSFVVYSVENGSRTFKKVYTKTTNAEGYAKLNMKYNPGNYEIDINFGGDEEYAETTSTVKINVSGKIPKKTQDKKKTTNKTTSKKVTKTTYYDKYGRSPDNKKVLAIGRPSASGDQGDYIFYGMEFKNHCPKCGKDGTLFWDIFYAGNETGNWGKVRLTGNYEGSSAEGAIFCSNQKCDGDWSCQGREHGYDNTRLTTTKKRFKSSKTDAYKLKKGKYVYNKSTKTVKSKNNTSTVKRKIIGKPSAKIKQLALKIVGNKTGYAAMKAIVEYMDKNIWYKYYCGFCRSPDEVVSSKHGNCCDQTRLILQLFDAAGLNEFYKLYYCHVKGHVYGIIKSRKTGKMTYIDPASDSHSAYGYVCQGYAHGSPSTSYPTRPAIGCGGC